MEVEGCEGGGGCRGDAGGEEPGRVVEERGTLGMTCHTCLFSFLHGQ